MSADRGGGLPELHGAGIAVGSVPGQVAALGHKKPAQGTKVAADGPVGWERALPSAPGGPRLAMTGPTVSIHEGMCRI